MKRSTRSGTIAFPFFLLFFLVVAGAGVIAAQAPHPQPELLLVFGNEAQTLNEEQLEARRLLFAAVEARFNAQNRYRLSRTATDLQPEQFVVEDEGEGGVARPRSDESAILFLRVTSRLDGSFRVDADVYHDGGFRASWEDELPTGGERFPDADRIANELTDAVAALYPGFGRVRFTNTGYPANYVVRVDGLTIGSNIDEIDLPIGSYEIEIRRRDDRFSHPVGRRTLTLGDDDFIEIAFALDQNPPVVPGYMRLIDPSERWRVIFTLRGSSLLPLEGFKKLAVTETWSTSATALFADVPFRAAVLGVETGYVRFNGEWDVDNTLAVEMNPVLGNIGLTIGPVSGVDFVARVGGGVVLYRVTETFEFDGIPDETYRENRQDPGFSGTAEFGFGLGEKTRLSLQTALLGIISEGDLYSWLQLGIGVGGRF